MAMSRSRGGTSLTTSPPIQISPAVISSRPAIMRNVVDLPQPEGPTSTTNSWSAISRSMPFTAWTSPSYSLTTLRIETSAIVLVSLCHAHLGLAFRGAGCQSCDIVVHEESVNDDRRGGGQHAGGHDLAPLEHVAADKVADDADRQYHLVGRVEIGQRIEEAAPADSKGEDRRRDDAGHRHGDEYPP